MNKDFSSLASIILNKQLQHTHEEEKNIEENIVRFYGVSEEEAKSIYEISQKAGIHAYDMLRVLGNITQPATMKMFCNNWRRMHGMPMIKRKENRQEHHKYDIIAKGKVKACKLTKKQKRCCKK